MTRKVAIFGTGGFGREVLCCLTDQLGVPAAEMHKHACFVINDEYYTVSEVMGIPVLRASEVNAAEVQFVIGIGDPVLRKQVAEQLPAEAVFARVIHPSAVISPWATLGEGCVVTAGVIITCNIAIGKHAHLNLHTTIGHDCQIGDYFTTAPGVNLSGNCRIGDNVYLGTNAALKQGITITDNVTIGMGGIVLKDVNLGGVYVGNPVRRLENK